MDETPEAWGRWCDGQLGDPLVIPFQPGVMGVKTLLARDRPRVSCAVVVFLIRLRFGRFDSPTFSRNAGPSRGSSSNA